MQRIAEERFRARLGPPRPLAVAEAQRVRYAVLSQRGEIERGWGRIERLSDQEAPGRVIVRTSLGYVLLFGLDGNELWVEVIRG
jgi:hypothetical protein